jgi:hypothetical protein
VSRRATYEPFITGSKILDRNFTVSDPRWIRRIQRRARLTHERLPDKNAAGSLGGKSAARLGPGVGAVLRGAACLSDLVCDYADRIAAARAASVRHNEQRCRAPRMLRSGSPAISYAASERRQSSRDDLWPVTAFFGRGQRKKTRGSSGGPLLGARPTDARARKARSRRCLCGQARPARTSQPANPDRRKCRAEPAGGP